MAAINQVINLSVYMCLCVCACVCCPAATIAGLQAEIKEATKALIDATSTVSVSSGCELFVRFITLTEMGEEAVRFGRGEVFYVCCCCLRHHQHITVIIKFCCSWL